MKKILFLMFLIIFPFSVFADEAKYNGDYSLDYLLRNYNVITFNQLENPQNELVEEFYFTDINTSIQGPVLINGNYDGGLFNNKNLFYSDYNPNNAISHIKGEKSNNVTSSSITSFDENFIDYNKLYKSVLAESTALSNIEDYNINSMDIIIETPGIYQINSTYFDDFDDYSFSLYGYINLDLYRVYTNFKYIYIDNYDPDGYYIFNNLKTYEFDNYKVLLKGKDDSNFKTIDEFADTDNYTGNIIFNYPNARFILDFVQSGKIIAPKADVFLARKDSNDFVGIYESVFANTISNVSIKNKYDNENRKYIYYTEDAYMAFVPFSSNKKIEFSGGQVIDVVEVEDFEDDIYFGEYSIYEMLKNYSIVSLGLKPYESNTWYYKNGFDSLGNVSIFHIVGQFLINGDISASRLDLESNRVHESFYKNAWFYTCIDDDNCNRHNRNTFKSWGDDLQSGTNSVVFSLDVYSDYSDYYDTYYYHQPEYYIDTDYINFERLYESIVNEQKTIKKGKKVNSVDGTAHIGIGSNYYIENVNDLDEIIFDNFSNNEGQLTVITILDEGEVYLPLLSHTSSGNYVSTKDYLGKAEPMFEYEYYNFPDDIYYGNVIWNIPNAKYIKLAEDAPFFGHIVAPNADLETTETHFAGGFIVNSLYAEGNSEAHFYPLQPVEVPEDFDCSVVNQNFYAGKWYTQEEIAVVAPPVIEESNPKTGDNWIIFVILLITMVIGVVFVVYIDRYKNSLN